MNSETLVFDDIPLAMDENAFLERIRVKKDSSLAADSLDLVRKAAEIARPRAALKAARFSPGGDDKFLLDGIPFTSSVLGTILNGTDTVLVNLATAGPELDEWSSRYTDMFLSFCAEEIKSIALERAAGRLRNFAEKEYPEVNSFANPGSTVDWPLDEIKKLFGLLGRPEESVSVSLTDNFMMVPVKSVCGIAFHADPPFFNCLLCRQEDCPGRRADFDPALHDLHCIER